MSDLSRLEPTLHESARGEVDFSLWRVPTVAMHDAGLVILQPDVVVHRTSAHDGVKEILVEALHRLTES